MIVHSYTAQQHDSFRQHVSAYFKTSSGPIFSTLSIKTLPAARRVAIILEEIRPDEGLEKAETCCLVEWYCSVVYGCIITRYKLVVTQRGGKHLQIAALHFDWSSMSVHICYFF